MSAARDGETGEFVVLHVRIEAPDPSSRRLLACVSVASPWAFGHHLCHIVTRANTASRPAEQISNCPLRGNGRSSGETRRRRERVLVGGMGRGRFVSIQRRHACLPRVGRTPGGTSHRRRSNGKGKRRSCAYAHRARFITTISEWFCTRSKTMCVPSGDTSKF